MESPMTKESILERMKRAELMTPAEVFRSYCFLSATLAEEMNIASQMEADMAKMEREELEKGKTNAAAKTMVRGSQLGHDALMMNASVRGLTECIRALKKVQQHYETEARNHY